MQATVDPFPSQVESLATSLEGEIQRLRSVIKTLTGWTQWYTTNQRITLPNPLTVNSLGPHAIGGAAIATVDLLTLTGTLATDTNPVGIYANPTLTAGSGSTTSAYVVRLNGSVTTAAASFVMSDAAQLLLNPPTITLGAGSSIVNASTLKITAAPTAGNTNYALWVASGATRVDGILQLSGTILLSGTAPTISTGFGTSPSIVSNNGTSTFRVNVGTGGTATTGTVGMPAATTGWNCQITDTTNNTVTRQTGGTTTTVAVTAAAAWAASDILIFNCAGY